MKIAQHLAGKVKEPCCLPSFARPNLDCLATDDQTDDRGPGTRLRSRLPRIVVRPNLGRCRSDPISHRANQRADRKGGEFKPFSVQLESRRVALRPVRRLGAVLAAVKIAPFGDGLSRVRELDAPRVPGRGYPGLQTPSPGTAGTSARGVGALERDGSS